MAKLNLELAEQIRRRAAAGERQLDLANAFGVTPPTIHQVVRGNLYPDQPRPPRQPTPTATRILEVLKGRSSALFPMELVEVTGLSRLAVGGALKTLRREGLVERLGRYQATRYRWVRPAAQPVATSGSRPRLLGLRAAWLRQYPAQPEPSDA